MSKVKHQLISRYLPKNNLIVRFKKASLILRTEELSLLSKYKHSYLNIETITNKQ